MGLFGVSFRYHFLQLQFRSVLRARVDSSAASVVSKEVKFLVLDHFNTGAF